MWLLEDCRNTVVQKLRITNTFFPKKQQKKAPKQGAPGIFLYRVLVLCVPTVTARRTLKKRHPSDDFRDCLAYDTPKNNHSN